MIPSSQSRGWAAIVLAADATIRELSPAAERLTGRRCALLLGRPVTEILAERSVFDAARMLAAARERGIWEGETFCRDASGAPVRGHGLLVPLQGEEPEGGFLLLIREALPGAMPAEGGLPETASRLRALAHRMNNPLAVMMGFAQLLLMEMPAGDPDREHVARMYAEMKRLAEAVEALHDYALSLEPVPQAGAGRGPS